MRRAGHQGPFPPDQRHPPSPVRGTALLCVVLIGLGAGCASRFEEGTALYREGDLRGALDLWRSISPSDGDYASAQEQVSLVEAEFERLLRQYERKALYHERRSELGDALLWYRLALKLDPDRPSLLERVQNLSRELDEREARTRAEMQASIDEGDIREAGAKARTLEQLNPFKPGLQREIRQVKAALGEQILRYIAEGKASYRAKKPEEARAKFERVLELDPDNASAIAYLGYLSVNPKSDSEELPPAARSQSEILAEGHYRAGSQAEKEGEPYRALEQYEEALRLDRSHPRAAIARADLRGRLRERIDELQARAKRYFQDEDLQNAVLMWKRVLMIAPETESAAYNLARAERMLAKLEELQAGGSDR